MHYTSTILTILSILASSVISTPVLNDQLSFSTKSTSSSSSKEKAPGLFACPTWKVRCVVDAKGWPSGIVGDVSIYYFNRLKG